MRAFALTVPGMRPLLTEEAAERAALSVTDGGNDGRADVALLETEAADAPLALRTAEDVFVEVGRTKRSSGDDPRWIARRIWRPERVQRALAAVAGLRRPPPPAASFRVVTRLLQERAFLRTELRRQLVTTIRRAHPDWRVEDPAGMEVWVLEYRPGRIIAGLRVSGAAMRQHGGRAVQRAGALRPAVAAGMVRLARRTDHAETLLDPCCGSGTVLSEALHGCWSTVYGTDISGSAVRTAKRNAARAQVRQGDARQLDLPDGAVAAVVSNLPFGKQYKVRDSERWIADVLAEADRVTAPGGAVVVLVPAIPKQAIPRSLALRRRVPLRLLGTKTTVWCFDRTG
ncbi:MAG: TRM11 family SAM-dependent methyltransferase [Streptosporangiales bacterium]